MERDREPVDDPREVSSDDASNLAEPSPFDPASLDPASFDPASLEPGPADRASRPGAGPLRRGRHDVVETDETPTFWDEVDGMLTGEFTAELLPRDGDYRLGALDDVLPPPPRPAGLGAPDDPAPTDATGPVAGLSNERSAPRRGAHDVDPGSLGFDDLDYPPPAHPGTVGRHDIRSGEAPPTVATEPVSGAGGSQPDAGGARSNRLFASDPAQTVASPPPGHGTGSLFDNPPSSAGHVPLFDPTGELHLSTQAGGASPVSLERSTVVDPVDGPAPGSSFLEGDPGATARHGAAPAPPAVNLEHAGHAVPPGPAAFHHPEPPTGYDSRSILLDVVDRQWLTSGLVAVAAISVGVIGWLVLLGGDDSAGGTDLLAASTTVADPAGPEASDNAAAASAGAGTGTFGESSSTASTAATTESTEPVTSRRRAPTTRRPSTTAEPTPTSPAPTQPTTTPTTDPTSSTPTSDSSSSSSSSSDTTTDTSTTTSDTSEPTVTTAGTGSTTTTEDTTTSSSDTTTDTGSTTETSETPPGNSNPAPGP